nr:amino acid adenylation domain-containing protein [Rhodococcus sp. (in: high G+C Gram-positive bacteria)]
MTSAQEAIWLAQHLSPEVPFTIAYYVDLVGEIDVDLLSACAHRAHVEFGSTTVRFEDDDGPVQRVGRGDLPVTVVDFRTATHPSADARTWMDEHCESPLPITSECLVTAAILRIGDDRCWWYTRSHHIVLDGYASTMVLRRIAELFLAAGNGTEPSPVGALDPTEAATVDTDYTTSARYHRDKHYWSTITSELGPQSSLAGRSAAPSPRPLRVSGSTTNLRTSESHRWSDRGTQSSTVLVAAFAALHARLTDSVDTVLSLPLAGRPTARLRRSGGTYSNVVPLRLPGIGATTVDGAVKLTELAVTSALRHQLFPAAGSSDGRSPGPVVNLMLFDDRIPLGTVDGTMHILSTGPIADIALDVHPGRSDAQWGWEFEANPVLYTHADVKLVSQRFLHFLEQFLDPENRDRNIADLGITSPDEEDTTLTLSGRAAPATATLGALLTRFATTHVDSPAVCGDGTEISYRELDRRSTTLAAALHSNGIGHGDVVAVMVPRSIDSVVAVWAVQRAGATYLPLDTRHPRSRIAYMLADSAAAIVVCTDSTGASVPPGMARLDIASAGDALNRVVDLPSPLPSSAAYIIYTSGTSGTPKGVVVTHAGLGPLHAQIDDAYRLGTNSRVLHLASPGFDTSLVEILAAASAGCTLVLPPPDVIGGPELTEVMAEQHVTHVFTTPSVLATLEPQSLAELEVVITGGEGCPQQLADTLSAQVTLFNAYGPTEATCSVTMTDALSPGNPVTIGTPMRGVELEVLDRDLRPRPAGTLGELYICGPAVARGYVGRSAETASRFVAAPFGEAGQRMYRTGDIVRQLPDGSIDYIGRADAQIELHGIRIEPAEIDAAVCTLPAVHRSVTVLADMGDGHPILATYVVAAPNETVDPVAARTYLAGRLPAVMVPGVVIVLDSMPLTTNRKVDVRSLPAPTPSTTVGGSTAPRGDVESALAEIFCAVLSVDSVDADASFFDLGGTSLAATRIVSRIRSSMKVTVGVRDLVANPSVRSLATTLVGAEVVSIGPIPGRSDSVAVIPLAPAQAHIDRSTDEPLYNLPFTIEVRSALNTAALEAAVRDIVERHRTLRTVYQDSAWGPRQIVVPLHEAHIPLHACDSEESLISLLHRGFDVGSELPIRFGYHRRADNTYSIGCVIHHIAADGWSLAVLAREMLLAYGRRENDAAPLWPELPLHYSDYALWAQTPADVDEVDYWRSELADLPDELQLPFDRPRPHVASLRAGRVSTVLDARAVARLTSLAAGEGAGLFTALRAAVLVTLARVSGSTDIVIGTPTAGRTDPILDDVVGMFVNTLALRTDIAGAQSISDVLRLCHDTEVRALDHTGVQFEDLVRILAPSQHCWIHPFFQVALSFDSFVSMSLDTEYLDADIIPRPVDIARCDLHIHIAAEPSDTGTPTPLTLDIVYARDLFDEHTVVALSSSLITVITDIVTDPTTHWSIPRTTRSN